MNTENSTEIPLVSIVTPSLNQGQFLPAMLKSVEEQTYQDIEHIIMDGGSTDDSVEIIRAYAKIHPGRVSWVSESDDGQADAINKGMAKASGKILAYLNADDTYERDAVEQAVAFFRQNPGKLLVHGQGFHVDPEGRMIEVYPSQECSHAELAENCYICQPTAFWRCEVLDTIGQFDVDLKYAMDYDYWIRISGKYEIGYIESHLANTRLHADAKTVSGRKQMHSEIVNVVKSHYGRVSDHWIFSYAHSFPLIDRLRSGGVCRTTAYVTLFTFLSTCLFLRFNHYIPMSAVKRFFHRR